jgi:hypothetical protein
MSSRTIHRKTLSHKKKRKEKKRNWPSILGSGLLQEAKSRSLELASLKKQPRLIRSGLCPTLGILTVFFPVSLVTRGTRAQLTLFSPLCPSFPSQMPDDRYPLVHWRNL